MKNLAMFAAIGLFVPCLQVSAQVAGTTEAIGCQESKLATEIAGATCTRRPNPFQNSNGQFVGNGFTYNTFSNAGGVWVNFRYFTTPTTAYVISNRNDALIVQDFKTYSPTTQDNTKNWSEPAPGPEGSKMVRFEDRNGRNCFMLNQWGPLQSGGYAWRLIGGGCEARGKALTDERMAEIFKMVTRKN